jgi:hypothetical protein
MTQGSILSIGSAQGSKYTLNDVRTGVVALAAAAVCIVTINRCAG